MELETTRFGKLEIDDNEVIAFREGLYGFEDKKEFVLLADEAPFFWLQSATDPDLAFVVTEPWNFCSEYEFRLKEKIENELKLKSKEDVLVINIVVIPENPEEMTMNLKAPIVINKNESIAKQIILEDKDYPIKYRLLDGEETISA